MLIKEERMTLLLLLERLFPGSWPGRPPRAPGFPTRPGPTPGRAPGMRGSALLIAVLVMATLTVLGLGYLALADTETLISGNDRDAEQLLHVGESGMRAVKAWFDQPVTGNPAVSTQVLHRFLEAFDMRNPSFYVRTNRVLDDDGDPNTPPVLADGTAARPYYRQGRTLWAPSAFLDFFHKPYRGDLTTTFLGTESGPDLLIVDTPGVVDLIDLLNQRLFTDQSSTGRIVEIAVYGAPEVDFGSGPRRAGICTIKVTSAKFRRMGTIGIVPVVTASSIKVAERVTKMILSEVPGTAANGPLESCGPLTVTGALNARWGKVIASGDVALTANLDAGVASAYPYKTFARRISGLAPGDDFYAWLNVEDSTIEDPWLKVLTAGDLTGSPSTAQQPHPYAQGAPIDVDHSNLFQLIPGVACGVFDYARMKSAASSGEETARYFTYDAASGLFREWGVGPARSVSDWTHNQEGLFFFDTIDLLPPNGHGPGDPLTNLTPPVVIENTDYAFSGLLYLNAESITIRNVTGVNRVIIPPGEPFDDANGNGRYDSGEAFVNLVYPISAVTGSAAAVIQKNPGATQTGSATSPDLETYSFTTTTGRDSQGIPFTGTVNVFGVLFNAGNVVAEGAARHYGSFIAGTAVVQATPGADSPEIFFDQRLNTGLWPPAEIAFPRTQLSRWSGDS